MAPRYFIAKKKNQPYKRYIKFLAINQNKKITKQILKAAPDKVIKAICNAAVNAQHGDIALSKSQKKLFSKNKSIFRLLNSKSIPIVKKRRGLQRGGGLALLPILLSTALSTLGSLFMNRNKEE